MGKENPSIFKWIALVITGLQLLLAVVLYMEFDPTLSASAHRKSGSGGLDCSELRLGLSLKVSAHVHTSILMQYYAFCAQLNFPPVQQR